MTLRTNLLAGVAMTAAEQSQGRFMRAPDGHPEAPAPAAEAPPAEAPAPAAEAPAGGETAPVSFDDAFAAAAAAADGKPAPAPAEAPAPAPADTPPAPAPAATPPAPEAPAPAPAATPPAPAAPSLADDVLARLVDKLNPPAPAPAAAPAAEAPPIYTTEETAMLTEFEKNWPDVAQAGRLERRAEYHGMMQFVFQEMAKYVAPLFEQVTQFGNTLHMGELKEKVEGYDPALEADVATWVDTQPDYLQGPYKHVMQNGTSDQVADLIGRYRTATGTVPAPAPAPAGGAPAPAPAPAAAPTPPKPAGKTELSQAAKQAAASLAPVSGDRSQAPVSEDTQDFSTAFERYAKEAAA